VRLTSVGGHLAAGGGGAIPARELPQPKALIDPSRYCVKSTQRPNKQNITLQILPTLQIFSSRKFRVHPF